MTNVNPTIQKPAPPGLTDLLDALKREIMKEINCAKIGTIKAFDAGNQTVTVQIAMQQVTSIAPDGVKTLADYPLLLEVPVFFPAGGGYTLTFPIAQGDECLVVFNDRQLDNWFTSGAGLPPTIGRVHDLSDGIAYVGLRNSTRSLGGVSTSAAQLRSDDGLTYVEIDASGKIVTIRAEEKVILDTKVLQVNGIINVINENSEINGCNVSGDIIADTISLVHHVHSGVQTGGSNTGEPV